MSTKFKKGQSGNPGGRPKLSKEVRALREGLMNEVVRCMSAFIHPDRDEARRILTGEGSSQFTALFYEMIEKGDWKVVSSMIDRVLGKVPDNVEVVSADDGDTNLNDEQKLRMAEEWLRSRGRKVTLVKSQDGLQ